MQLDLLTTGRPAWDKVLGGGVARGGSVLVAGKKGVGKSTAALDIARRVAARLHGPIVYASAEMPDGLVKAMAERIGFSDREMGDLYVDATGQTENVVRAIDALEPAVIVWDSIQRHRVEGRLGDRELVDTVTTAIERGRAHEAVSFLLSQVTKDGTTVGPSGIDHDVDVCLFLRRVGRRIAVEVPEKNRFAPTPPARAFEDPFARRRRRSR